MPPNQHQDRAGGATDLMDADISFPLARLFDPYNLDHVSENKRMDEFEHRDLAHVKHYKAAVKIFGGPLSRKRIIVAPAMETPMKHRLGLYYNQTSPPAPPKLNSQLKPQIPAVPPLPEEIVAAKAAEEREDKYRAWFLERQKFRNNLESMGLNIDWLSNKPSKTLLERRVLRKLKDDENRRLAEKELKHESSSQVMSQAETAVSEPSSVPNLRVPAPEGMKILGQHLREQKLRLVDLFTSVDKNKDWKLSREEFIKVCEEKQIPLSEELLEDMLVTLDMNLDDELDYREMAIGMDAWRRQRREDRRKELSREATTVSSKSGVASTTPAPTPVQQVANTTVVVCAESDRNVSRGYNKSSPSQPGSSPRHLTPQLTTNDGSLPQSRSRSTARVSKSPDDQNQSGSRSTARVTKSPDDQNQSGSSSGSKGKGDTIVIRCHSARATSPNTLEPPPSDLRPEQLVLDTEEAMIDLRKRNRDGLKGYTSKVSCDGLKGYTSKLDVPPNTIKSGSRAIDNHSMKSTLDGDVGQLVDNFRQKRLQEFYEIVKLCDDSDMVLSRRLLERVLLYPAERPHGDIQKIRPPDSAPLISSHFADPPKRPRTPLEVKHKDKVRRSSSGRLLIDSRHKYPSYLHVAPQGSKQNLSTGRAVIRRKIDCWMTFEQYERMTRHLAVRYQHLHGKEKTGSFWPGELLDKIRLCMPPYNQPAERDKELALYSRVRRTPAVNYNYEPVDVWPANNAGYVQVGIYDHYKHKNVF